MTNDELQDEVARLQAVIDGLHRERTEMREREQEYLRLVAEVRDRADCEIQKLRQDAARLDWIEAKGPSPLMVPRFNRKYYYREAIDAARKGGSDGR